jgi:Spy/CpxP family protein refolding chaperone
MNYFANIRFYKWLIVILLILNIATLSFTIFSHLPHRPFRELPVNNPVDKEEMHKRNEIFLQRELNLDDEQMNLFRQSRKQHFSAQKELMKKNRMIREELSEAIFQTQFNQNKTDSLITLLGKITIAIETLNAQHFIELRSFCRPDQQQKFGKVFREIIVKPGAGADRPPKGMRHPKGKPEISQF